MAAIVVATVASPQRVREAEEASRWDARVRAEAPLVRTGGRAYRSSSRLNVTFSAARVGVHHYDVVARERGTGRIAGEVRASASASQTTLNGLAAGETYAIDVTACLDAQCGVGVSDAVASSDPLSVLHFTSLAGQSGLVTPSAPATLVADVATGQAVPLASGLVRLFFEARGADGRTRIMHIDSKDGFVGRDFNAGPSTVCSTSADYAAGGPCAPVLDVSVSTDPGGNPGFTDARQFKIGYPLLDDWRFHETPGTFMILTVSGATACTRAARTSAYALWDGSRFVVQYQPNGCPKLFENIQAPMPVHLGGGRYKMYFGNPTEMTGILTGSTLPWLGPKRVAYADAGATGDPDVVEFEDWEPLALARDIHFVWPSGRSLTDREAGYLDDFVMLTPTGDPGVQVMYTAMTDGRIAPFATMAVLLNP